MKAILRYKGGPGSGNWGHAGIPGQVGGSMPQSQAMSRTSGKTAGDRRYAKIIASGKLKDPIKATRVAKTRLNEEWSQEHLEQLDQLGTLQDAKFEYERDMKNAIQTISATNKSGVDRVEEQDVTMENYEDILAGYDTEQATRKEEYPTIQDMKDAGLENIPASSLTIQKYPGDARKLGASEEYIQSKLANGAQTISVPLSKGDRKMLFDFYTAPPPKFSYKAYEKAKTINYLVKRGTRMTAKYNGKDFVTGAKINAGDTIIYSNGKVILVK